MELDFESMGRWLRERREEQGLSQAEVERIAGLSKLTVRRMEKGESPKLVTLARMAAVLNVGILEMILQCVPVEARPAAMRGLVDQVQLTTLAKLFEGSDRDMVTRLALLEAEVSQLREGWAAVDALEESAAEMRTLLAKAGRAGASLLEEVEQAGRAMDRAEIALRSWKTRDLLDARGDDLIGDLQRALTGVEAGVPLVDQET